MSAVVAAPILVPLLAGAMLLVLGSRSLTAARAVGGAALLALLAAVTWLAGRVAAGDVLAYLLGNWPAPFGIALAADRLAVLMLAVTAVLGTGCWLAALGGTDREGPHFHALLQFQLAGLNGAFLTADLFNLFVFFEVLLIASYALLLHGSGGERLRPGLHYVLVNLAGSALFLVAAAVIYGATGTLNLADLALLVRDLRAADTGLVRTAGALLLVVFAVKSALLPLHLWLPQAYRVATVPVATLFVVMTKVGVYGIARVFTLVFEAGASRTAGFATPWLYAAGLATLGIGALGALGARDLRSLAAWLVLVSAGTLLAALAPFDAPGLGSALFYLAPSAIAGAALFLVAGVIATQRGPAADDLRPEPGGAPRTLSAALFVLFALAIAGLPPFAGFLAKIEILASAPGRPVLWVVLLLGSLAVVLALARAGSTLFWNLPPDAASSPARRPPSAGAILAVAWLATWVVLLVPAAGTLQRFAREAAVQLVEPRAYVAAVLGARPVPRPGDAAPQAEADVPAARAPAHASAPQRRIAP